jgi:diguanylate cyclase (GGDEF)-like protein
VNSILFAGYQIRTNSHRLDLRIGPRNADWRQGEVRVLAAKETRRRCILTVDDDRVLLAVLYIGMRNAGYDIIQATSAEEALKLVEDRTPDLALLDISMPGGMSGLELAKKLRETTAIPFMFLTSHSGVDIVREAAHNGAVGYLVKPVNMMHIIPAVEAALVRAAEIRQLQRIGAELSSALASGRRASEFMRNELERLVAQHTAELTNLNSRLDQAQRRVVESKEHARELSRLANEDPLTALPNRNWLMSYLPTALARANDNDRMLALLYLDLDGFKSVNDSLGHLAGDELLRAAALRMRSALKPSDNIARHGGDEFIIIIEQVSSESDASNVAHRMAEVLKNPFELSHGRNEVGASIGISLYPRDGSSAEELLKKSDLALYQAKSAGKGHFRFYQPGLVHSLCR